MEPGQWAPPLLALLRPLCSIHIPPEVLDLTCAGLVEETRLGSGDCTYRRVESLGDRRQLGADYVDEAGAASQAAVSAEEQLQQVALGVVS